MKFIELTDIDSGGKFLFDVDSGWQVTTKINEDTDEENGSYFYNSNSSNYFSSKETYQEIKQKLLPELAPVQTGFVDNTRPVTVFDWYRNAGLKISEKRETSKGKFHSFSSNFEEFDEGPANYATAIIELPDGTVLNHPVELIRFDDKEAND